MMWRTILISSCLLTIAAIAAAQSKPQPAADAKPTGGGLSASGASTANTVTSQNGRYQIHPVTDDVSGGKLEQTLLLDTVTGRIWALVPAPCPHGYLTIGRDAEPQSARRYCFAEIDRLDFPATEPSGK